jgi:hypothetical protein
LEVGGQDLARDTRCEADFGVSAEIVAGAGWRGLEDALAIRAIGEARRGVRGDGDGPANRFMFRP